MSQYPIGLEKNRGNYGFHFAVAAKQFKGRLKMSRVGRSDTEELAEELATAGVPREVEAK